VKLGVGMDVVVATDAENVSDGRDGAAAGRCSEGSFDDLWEVIGEIGIGKAPGWGAGGSARVE